MTVMAQLKILCKLLQMQQQQHYIPKNIMLWFNLVLVQLFKDKS